MLLLVARVSGRRRGAIAGVDEGIGHLTPMRCHTIQFWDFREFAHKNPDVMWKLLQHVAVLLLTEQSRHAAQGESASP